LLIPHAASGPRNRTQPATIREGQISHLRDERDSAGPAISHSRNLTNRGATDRKGGAESIEAFLADDILTRIQRLKPLAAYADLTMAQMALAWVLGTDGVSAAIIGASQPVQVLRTRTAPESNLTGI
jgi:aryl-alcohol dehydrogenase-like predicted oxidoreductase